MWEGGEEFAHAGRHWDVQFLSLQQSEYNYNNDYSDPFTPKTTRIISYFFYRLDRTLLSDKIIASFILWVYLHFDFQSFAGSVEARNAPTLAAFNCLRTCRRAQNNKALQLLQVSIRNFSTVVAANQFSDVSKTSNIPCERHI